MKLRLLSRRARWFTAGLACAVGILILVLLNTVHVHSDDPEEAPDSYFTGTAPYRTDQQTANNNLATKVAVDTNEAQRMQEGQARITITPDSLGPPPETSPEPLPTGILPDPLPMPAGWSSLYKISNTWQNVINGIRMVAYAGLKYDADIRSQKDTTSETASQAAQGVLIIMTFPSNGNLTSDEHLTPARTGALRLVTANGTQLTLESTTISARYVFDVQNHNWLGEPIPIPRSHYCQPVTETITSSPPISTTSYYVYKTGATEDGLFFNDGLVQGRRSATAGPHSGIVILDFGQPWMTVTGGTSSFGILLPVTNKWAPIGEIERAVQFFADGFYKGSNETPSSDPAQLILLIGLSNYGLDYKETPPIDLALHGKRWGEMVKRLGDYTSVYKNIVIDAGIDIEFPWNTAKLTRNWADGYSSAVASTGHYYYNFGSCTDCFPLNEEHRDPNTNPPYLRAGQPDQSWHLEDIQYISSKGLARPLPQTLYPVRPTSNQQAPQIAQACQWENLSRWMRDFYGVPIRFAGIASGWQTSGDPTYTLTAEAAWKQFNAALRSNPDFVDSSTDLVRAVPIDDLKLTDFTTKGHAPSP